MVKKKAENNETIKMSIIGQYLKDLSFESPNAPDIFQNKSAPNVDVNINIVINKSGSAKNIYESSLKVKATLTQEEKTSFIVEVDYAALVEIVSDNEDAIKAVLVKEVPKILFPYVRQIISSTSVQGGFPPLNIAPVNFEEFK
ncbi:MAG: protein-export chaperone SecB [Alphaproteobacteria bacterium]|jgi:preprotein translocase subunit SecB|nr:protein-export chaperone SecB [Alphaproteobacteria bacterium]